MSFVQRCDDPGPWAETHRLPPGPAVPGCFSGLRVCPCGSGNGCDRARRATASEQMLSEVSKPHLHDLSRPAWLSGAESPRGLLSGRLFKLSCPRLMQSGSRQTTEREPGE